MFKSFETEQHLFPKKLFSKESLLLHMPVLISHCRRALHQVHKSSKSSIGASQGDSFSKIIAREMLLRDILLEQNWNSNTVDEDLSKYRHIPTVPAHYLFCEDITVSWMLLLLSQCICSLQVLLLQPGILLEETFWKELQDKV